MAEESWQRIEQPAFFVIANVANYGASATKHAKLQPGYSP
jgi:hypothetical protein